MNKGLIKYLWALPLLGMLSGCSESALDEGSQNSKNEIHFDVTASKLTKATAVDKTVMQDKTKPFGLFAYSNGGWTQGTTAPSGQPNFMYNKEVKYDEDNGGGWTYTPLAFWTNDKISFFGYWPKVDGVTTAKADDGKMPEVAFTQNMNADQMIDFITSNNALNKTKADGTVMLEFDHMLTRVNFQARLDQSLGDDSKTHVYIKSLKVLGKGSNPSSKLYGKGTFVIGDGGAADGDGHWVLSDDDIQAGDLDVNGIMAKKTHTSTVVPDKNQPTVTYSVDAVMLDDHGVATDLLGKNQTSAKQEYLFLFPPTKNGIENADEETNPAAKADIKVMLDYDVVSEDADIPTYKGTVTENKDVIVPLQVGTLAQGKAYNVIFTVGLNEVKVDVDVKDWDDDVTSHAPSTDAADNSDANIIAAWAKMNTVKKTDTKANYFVINVANKPTGKLDLRTNVDADKVDLSAFELGDQVELLFADDKDGTGYKDDAAVSVPNGWVYENRQVGNVTRHIMTKVANYITKAADTNTQSDIIAAFVKLNAARETASDDIRYYAVNAYGTALTDLDLSTVTLDKFTKTTDKIYLIFKEENTSANDYKAPAGWTIEKTTTPGKYLLQQTTTKGGTSTNIAIGDAGFNLNGGTINVNK